MQSGGGSGSPAVAQQGMRQPGQLGQQGQMGQQGGLMGGNLTEEQKRKMAQQNAGRQAAQYSAFKQTA